MIGGPILNQGNATVAIVIQKEVEKGNRPFRVACLRSLHQALLGCLVHNSIIRLLAPFVGNWDLDAFECFCNLSQLQLRGKHKWTLTFPLKQQLSF